MEMPEPEIVENNVLNEDTMLSIDEFKKAESLDKLFETICECQKCELGKSRINFVFGEGNPRAEIMFVGEAPGADEDRQGRPFVGRAGKLLDKILNAMKLSRDDIYIANILKCRPPQNRDPLAEEAQTCEPFLHHQIKLIKPKIICCLGRIAAQRLLQTKMTLGKMRNQWFDYQGTILMVTYHPAALLRSNQYKRPLWDDMQKMLKKLEELKQ
ncbi:MAG: uracil-DNA glycosylase [candidate division Zixibacteria bacterium]|nr:uracil-DNA glycosylase [candidate division Zixibacteria bacterium]